MRLGITPGAYLIHGTNNPIAVGMAITHGCIRMYPEDIEALFPLVPVNTPVWLINEPVKVARVDGQVWLEVHPPVDDEGQRAEVDLEGFYALANAALGETPAAIHWDFVLATLEGGGRPAADGRPRNGSADLRRAPGAGWPTEPRSLRARRPRRDAAPATALGVGNLVGAISARTSAMRSALTPGIVPASIEDLLQRLRVCRAPTPVCSRRRAPCRWRAVRSWTRLDHDVGSLRRRRPRACAGRRGSSVGDMMASTVDAC